MVKKKVFSPPSVAAFLAMTYFAFYEKTKKKYGFSVFKQTFNITVHIVKRVFWTL